MNNRFAVLHGLRVLGILGIIQLHVTDEIKIAADPTHLYKYGPLGWWGIVSNNGWFAMDLFFILSGFLIGQILFYTQETTPSFGLKSFGRFYLRRCFRTFPLYYFFLFGYFFLCILWPDLRPFPIAERPVITSLNYHEIFYLTNYPFSFLNYIACWSWSLSAEEHFYLVVPVLVWGLGFLRSHVARILTLFVLWASGFFVRFFIVKNLVGKTVVFDIFNSIYTPTHARFDIFVAGILLAYVHQNFAAQLKKIFAIRSVQVVGAALVGAIFYILLSPTINPYPLDITSGNLNDHLWTMWTGVFYFGTLTGILYSILIPLLLFTNTFISKFLKHPAFLYLSTLGYGVYLVHMPVATVVVRWLLVVIPDRDQFIFWFLTFALTVLISNAIAYLLHLIVEKPFLWLRDKGAVRLS